MIEKQLKKTRCKNKNNTLYALGATYCDHFGTGVIWLQQSNITVW
jgi:hypothetical protein